MNACYIDSRESAFESKQQSTLSGIKNLSASAQYHSIVFENYIRNIDVPSVTDNAAKKAIELDNFKAALSIAID